jgi:Cytochrome P450
MRDLCTTPHFWADFEIIYHTYIICFSSFISHHSFSTSLHQIFLRRNRAMVPFAFLFLVIQLIVGWSSAFQQCTRRSSSAFFLLSTPSRRCVLQLSSCPVPLEFRRSISSSSTLLVSATMNDTLTYSPEIATASSSPTTTTTTATIPKLLGPASGIGFLAASLAGKPHKYLHSLQKRHGGVENFIIRPNIVVLNDPAAIRDVLETYNLPKTPKVRLGYKSIFYGNQQNQRGKNSSHSNSGGILAAPWNKWLQQRRMAAPALAESMIGRLAPKFHDVSVPWFEYLESMATTQPQKQPQQRQPVDMSAAFTAVTMDAIGTILLGKSFGMCQQLRHLQHSHQPGTTRSRGAGAAEVPFAAALHRLTGKC